jgi:hypothetical protein
VLVSAGPQGDGWWGAEAEVRFPDPVVADPPTAGDPATAADPPTTGGPPEAPS